MWSKFWCKETHQKKKPYIGKLMRLITHFYTYILFMLSCRSLVLELCVGTLEDVFLGPCDHLPMSEIPDHFQGLLHMARGLEHIHSKGMLHGSVKPSNILISKTVHSGVVLKVSQDSVSTLTQKLSFNAVLSLQTLKYWPPEALKLLDGNETLKRPTASGDIFALGCIFHGYVSDGAHPFGRGVHVLFNIMGSINFLASNARNINC